MRRLSIPALIAALALTWGAPAQALQQYWWVDSAPASAAGHYVTGREVTVPPGTWQVSVEGVGTGRVVVTHGGTPVVSCTADGGSCAAEVTWTGSGDLHCWAQGELVAGRCHIHESENVF